MMRKLLHEMYEKLLVCYGEQHWWPGESPWEICVGAVLTQNTNWGNVERAINNLKVAGLVQGKASSHRPEHYPAKFANTAREDLNEMLRPSGYYRLKTERMLNVTGWWMENVRGGQLRERKDDLDFWRMSLLGVKGVGPETADSILLYAFSMPTFVVDAYTRRLMARHMGISPEIRYEDLRDIFMHNLPSDARLFNKFHALIVRAGKDDCRPKHCSCPLSSRANFNSD